MPTLGVTIEEIITVAIAIGHRDIVIVKVRLQ